MRGARESGDLSNVAVPIATVEAVAPSSAPAQDDGSAGVHAGSSGGVLLEARLVWGRDTIAVRHVRPRAEVLLGELALDVPGAPELVIAGRDQEGRFRLRLPNGALVPDDCRMTLRMGRAALRLSLVTDDLVMMPRARPDARVALGVLAAAALHLVMLGFVAGGRADEGVSEEAARATMQRLVSAAEERALAELAKAQEEARVSPPSPSSSAGPSSAAPSAEATSSLASRIAKAEAPAGVGAARPSDDAAGRAQEARAEAASFGMVAVLSRHGAGRGSASAFAAARGHSARGSLFVPGIDDAASIGGLGLSGLGEPGGGLGRGISLGRGAGEDRVED